MGDFLAFLTRDYYPACAHRVLRPTGGNRLSMPMLIRARAEHELDTRAYDTHGTNPHLVEVSGVRCRDLGRLFDARGKRLLDARRAAKAADAERRARAQAYRDAVRAGTISAFSSSSDSEPETEIRTTQPECDARANSIGKAA